MAKEPQKEVGPIFSVAEKRTVVRSFIDAYLRGTVKLNFISAEAKTTFLNAIKTVSASEFPPQTKTATQIESDMNFLFTAILAFRISENIEGEFLDAPLGLEIRVTELERKFVAEIETLSKILSYVRQWIGMYQPVLDEAAKDYADKLGRIESLDKKEPDKQD